MPTREKNVGAAQWFADGQQAIEVVDLTLPENNVYGENVFGPAAQRARLPKSVFRKLQATIERGAELDPSIADAVASAMKDWALAKGATQQQADAFVKQPYHYENQIEVPYRVVINEAVELAKSYGGTDGFKYVNGVLDRLAAIKRPHETARRAG